MTRTWLPPPAGDYRTILRESFVARYEQNNDVWSSEPALRSVIAILTFAFWMVGVFYALVFVVLVIPLLASITASATFGRSA